MELAPHTGHCSNFLLLAGCMGNGKSEAIERDISIIIK
jgi:hypothetical protein